MTYRPPRVNAQAIAHLILSPILLRWVMVHLFRVRLHREGPMITEPAIYAGNHRSFLDPVLIGSFCNRHLSYFARADLWKIPIIGQTLGLLGGFPVDRDEPQLAVLQRTVQHLRDGGSVLLFPEGTRTRSGRLAEVRDGIAVFARRSGIPVVPVYVIGTETVWPRGRPLPIPGGRAGLVIGRPLRAPAELRGREADRWLMERLRAWLAAQERRFLGPA